MTNTTVACPTQNTLSLALKWLSSSPGCSFHSAKLSLRHLPRSGGARRRTRRPPPLSWNRWILAHHTVCVCLSKAITVDLCAGMRDDEEA